MLQKFFDENPEHRALCRQVMSILTKERLTSIGSDLRRHKQVSSSSVESSSESVQLKVDILLGMNVMFAGGPVSIVRRDLSITEIEALALPVCQKGDHTVVKEETTLVIFMGLCPSGTLDANLRYILGGADRHYEGWDNYSPTDKTKLVKEILERVEKKHSEGGLVAVKEETTRVIFMGLCPSGTVGENLLYSLGGADRYYEGWDSYSPTDKAKLVKEILVRVEKKRTVWTVAGSTKGRTAMSQRTDVWDETLYELLLEPGHPVFELTPWAQGVQIIVHGVGPRQKETVLLTHGLLPQTSYKEAMRNFKDSSLNPTKPDSKAGPHDLKDWNQEMERAKFAYVRDTPFPKQEAAGQDTREWRKAQAVELPITS